MHAPCRNYELITDAIAQVAQAAFAQLGACCQIWFRSISGAAAHSIWTPAQLLFRSKTALQRRGPFCHATKTFHDRAAGIVEGTKWRPASSLKVTKRLPVLPGFYGSRTSGRPGAIAYSGQRRGSSVT